MAAKSEYQRKGLSNSTLKIIAMFSMLIDHIGAIILEQGLIPVSTNSELLQQIDFGMRLFGRLAFPIFCFLIVEGYFHTRDEQKYLTRLIVLAFISEIPFDLAFKGTYFDYSYQNVLFTLAFGLAALMMFEYFARSSKVSGIITVFVWAAIAQMLHTDYGAFGVLLIFVLYLYRSDRLKQSIWGGVMTIWEITAPLAFVLTYQYNDQRGLSLKWVFYAFYPVHILLLVWIRSLL